MLKKIGQNTRKKWILRQQKSEATENAACLISKELGVSSVLAQLLVNRGYDTPKKAEAFVHMESEMLCDPFEMKGMAEAVRRIRAAVENKEPIAVYGDYDVDGVTAVCTLYLYLRSKGGLVSYYIPNRAGEGYGVSKPAVQALAEQGARLIVTVDTGITATDEVAYAKEIGVDFVVTDHHECRSELPDAVAVVNPHRPDCSYPFKELAGVGVVFKLLCAYEAATTNATMADCVRRICREYADLIAIGTIADVMPLREENKLIVSHGLYQIENHCRPGLLALMEAANQKGDVRTDSRKPKQKITSGYIGYTIAPRLNAAGRIRSASIAVELFLAETEKRAAELSHELCEANKERQNEENKIMQDAYEKLAAEHDFENDPVIILDADNWHHGVIGIVSSRITERYGLPSVLVSFEGCPAEEKREDNIGKGSGRSIKGMNLVDALVHCSDCLVKFGGHELAAGLSITRRDLPEFRRRINEYARTILDDESIVPTLEADCELTLSDINMRVAEDLNLLEPYGVANPVPVFILRGVRLLECTPVSGGKHTRFAIGESGTQLNAMYFSHSPESLNLYPGDTVDVLFNLDINEWCGRRSVQLIVKDIRLSDEDENDEQGERNRFESIWSGAPFSDDEDIVPTRDDFAAVYNLVRRSVRSGVDTMHHRQILLKLKNTYDGQVGYVKLKFIIRILQELNLLGIEEVGEEQYRFKIQFTAGKTDLEKSNLLRRLRLQQKRA